MNELLVIKYAFLKKLNKMTEAYVVILIQLRFSMTL